MAFDPFVLQQSVDPKAVQNSLLNHDDWNDREHPLLKHQLATRSFIVRSLHRLGLDIEPARHEIGRPAGPYRGEV